MVGAGCRQRENEFGGLRGKRRRGVMGKKEGRTKKLREGGKETLLFLFFPPVPDRLKIKSLKS